MLKEQNNELIITAEFLCNPCWLMKNVFKQRVSIAHKLCYTAQSKSDCFVSKSPWIGFQHPSETNQPSVLSPEDMFIFVWLTATQDLLLSCL